jgi:hypothetical protein
VIWGPALKLIGGVFVTLVVGAIILPVLSGGREHKSSSGCYEQLRTAASSLVMYAADNGDYLPLPGTWMDVTVPYARNIDVYRCTVFDKESDFGIAMNSTLLSAKLLPEREIPLVFDSTNTVRNATAPLASVPDPGRHQGYDIVGFVDTHVKAMKPQAIRNLDRPVTETVN